MSLDEDLRIEAWRVGQFDRMGFDGGAILLLQVWETDLHEAARLMIRDGKRTTCTVNQALRILQPLDDVAVMLPVPEPAFERMPSQKV